MPFPESERVIYAKNPLEQVICQFRFPDVLRIGVSDPVGFQEKIRELYPIYREKAEVAITIPPEIAQQIPQEIAGQFGPGKRAYDFVSGDGRWVVGLTNNFVALTDNNYERWEKFRDHFEVVFNALVEEYRPSFFTRIGLRYRNLIKKSELDLEDADWSNLLNRFIVGELASPEIKDSIDEIAHIILMNLDDGKSKVRMQHGFSKDNKGNVIGYVIDNDFFLDEQREISDGLGIITRFNEQNRRLFRWSITERLHKAMEPSNI